VISRVLLLAGTAEARRLAGVLANRQGLRVVSSLAGRVRTPNLPAGEVRLGGFGGADSLARWLRAERVDALVDATHPFAAAITEAAAAASAATGIPLLVLRRPSWQPAPGDDWHWVGSLHEAASALPDLGARAFLTTGRQGLTAFAALDGMWFLVRSVDPPDPPLPAAMSLLLDRGPYTVDGELELLRRYRIDVLVTKDSGGSMTSAKLAAARAEGIPVLLAARQPLPAGVTSVVSTVEDAVAWLDARDGAGG
jgi:precorrin-6A/cobalt-precorrin-6A reductase